MGGKTNEEFVERCYRNTGAVPVPRKISKSYNQPLRRKISAPAAPPTAARPRPALPRQLSCPEPQPQPLHCATQQELGRLQEEEVVPLQQDRVGPQHTASMVQQPGQCTERAAVLPVSTKTAAVAARAVTREADRRAELKRGSMRDKWGLRLAASNKDNTVQLAVIKVGMFSPAAKAGIQPGDSVILVNDWKVEAMNNVPAALAVLLAAGFTVNLGWAKTDLSTEGWEHLEDV